VTSHPFLSHSTRFLRDPQGREWAVIGLRGELDLDSGALVSEVVELCLGCRPAGIRVDVSGLTLMDCAGLGQLHHAAQNAGRAGVSFVLTGTPQPVVGRVMRLTGTALGPLGETPAGPGPARPPSPGPGPVRAGWARLLRFSLFTASGGALLLALAESG
jgi:anti-anti-sigma factor